MTNENAKTFLRYHRNDIENRNRIIKLGKKIGLESVPVEQKKVETRKRKISGDKTFVAPAEVPNRTVKTSKKANTFPQMNITSSSNSECESSASDYEPPHPHLEKTEIITSDIVAALDRCQMTNQAAMMVIAPVVAASGQNMNKLNLSTATILRRRHKHRTSIDSTIRDNYDSGGTIVTVHYDSKKMKDFTHQSKQDNQQTGYRCIIFERLQAARYTGNCEWYWKNHCGFSFWSNRRMEFAK